MKLQKVTTQKGFNKDTVIASGNVIETICGCGPNGETRFLIHTGNGDECLALFMTTDEIAKAVTSAVIDKICLGMAQDALLTHDLLHPPKLV